MIPDLGKYAVVVLAAYGVSLGLIIGLVGLSLWQGARMKRALEAVERRQGADRG